MNTLRFIVLAMSLGLAFSLNQPAQAGPFWRVPLIISTGIGGISGYLTDKSEILKLMKEFRNDQMKNKSYFDSNHWKERFNKNSDYSKFNEVIDFVEKTDEKKIKVAVGSFAFATSFIPLCAISGIARFIGSVCGAIFK